MSDAVLIIIVLVIFTSVLLYIYNTQDDEGGEDAEDAVGDYVGDNYQTRRNQNHNQTTAPVDVVTTISPVDPGAIGEFASVYSDKNYGGTKAVLKTATGLEDFDTLGQLELRDGATGVKLCTEPNFKGCIKFDEQKYTEFGKNRVRSAFVMDDRGSILIKSKAGRAILAKSIEDTLDLKKISSLKCPASRQCTFYDDIVHSGHNSRTFQGDVSNVGSTFNDKTRSLKVE